MLVAEAVGPSGGSWGFDARRAPSKPRGTAPRRPDSVTSHLSSATTSRSQIIALFDAAIGRCVLVHQPDPAATVRRTAAAVRPGGIVAFMEPATHVSGHSMPEIPLVRAAGESSMKFMQVALPSHDIAGRIIPCFIDAGLPEPRVLWE